MESERVKEVIVDARINKVLSLRTDSIAMMEALEAIGEFYQTSTLSFFLFHNKFLYWYYLNF